MTYTIANPGTDNTLSTDAIRKHTLASTQYFASLQKLFSISIIDVTTRQVISADGLDPSKTRSKAEYNFSVAPRSLEIGEPFSTHVVPTQNNGMFVESHGSIFKQIKLSGTTGIRPNKSTSLPDQIPLLSGSVDYFVQTFSQSPISAPRLPESEVTGHDDIIFLRNIFRHFSDEIKRSQRRIAMVFYNVRDDDYWVVEPEDFRLTRSADKPLMYEYNISLKGIAKFTPVANTLVSDPMQRLRDARRFGSRIQAYAQALSSSFFIIATQITRATALGFTAVNTTLGSISRLVQGLQAIKDNAKAASNVRTIAAQLKQEVKDGWDKLTGKTDPQDDLIRCLRRLHILCCNVLVEQVVRDSVASRYNDTSSRINNAYKGKDPTQPTVGTVAQGTIRAGETIRDVARRLTGRSDDWKVLVQINNLKPPYVTSAVDAPLGVLKVGDTILYPSKTARDLDAGNIPSASNASNAEAENQGALGSPVVLAYGRDLRLLDSPRGTDFLLTDIAINQRGDLSTIVGLDNVEQAVKVKFATEQGELPKHPTFGTAFPIGSKATVDSFNTFRLGALATFASDSRVKKVKKLKFVAHGDVLSVSAVLELTDSKNFLSTDFALRR